MYSRELIFEYENVLTENKPSVNPFLFNRGDYENERKALYIMRYAIQTYLKWNPYEVRDHMTHRILKMLKLEALLKYITFPSVIQIEEDRDLFYLAVKLYPKQIIYNKKVSSTLQLPCPSFLRGGFLFLSFSFIIEL